MENETKYWEKEMCLTLSLHVLKNVFERKNRHMCKICLSYMNNVPPILIHLATFLTIYILLFTCDCIW